MRWIKMEDSKMDLCKSACQGVYTRCELTAANGDQYMMKAIYYGCRHK